jgi:tetratricopeptide (TPR) repeat protein
MILKFKVRTSRPPDPRGLLVAAWEYHQGWLVAALLWLATLALYWPVAHFEFIDFDDPTYVTDNAMVQQGLTAESVRWGLTASVCANWHPLTLYSHMLDCQLYGLDAGRHHITNLLFHAFNVVLAFLLFRRLTGALWRSALVAALFAWHPLHVESVAWIAERKDVLSAFFGLLSLLAYAGYIRETRETTRPFYTSSLYWQTAALFALGLLSKPMLVTWPFLLLVLDYWPGQRFPATRFWPLAIEKLPFFALSAGACVVTYLVHWSAGDMKALAGMGLEPRLTNIPIAYCRYLLKTFWPADLAVYYPHPLHWPAAEVVLAVALLAGLTFLVWNTRRAQPYLLAGWCWFIGMLVPVIGVVQIGRIAMADRYTYLPSLGLFAALVWGVAAGTQHWRRQAWWLTAAALVVLAACGATARHQLEYWQNSEVLFRHDLVVTADNETARNSLGVDLLRQGRTNDALAEFRSAIRLMPQMEEAHYNLGSLLAAIGQTNDAIRELNWAIQCQPDHPQAFNNLAILLASRGQTNEAITNFRAAIRTGPDYADAHFNFGNCLAQWGDLSQATREFAAAERLKPDDAEIHQRLAALYVRSGQAESALGEYAKIISLDTNNAEAYFRMGNLQSRVGRQDRAVLLYQQAVLLRPDFAEAHNNLGSLLSAQGHLPDAIFEFRQAVHSRPDYRDAHYNLANALYKTEQFDEAAQEYQSVLRLAPDFAPAHFFAGLIAERQGQTEQARAQFQEVLRLNPGSAEASNHLAHLRQNGGGPTPR